MDPPDLPGPSQEPEHAKRSIADFVVLMFACTVVVILVLLTIGIIIAAARGGDVGPYFSVLTNIMTSVISAVVGYLAGKGGKGPPIV